MPEPSSVSLEPKAAENYTVCSHYCALEAGVLVFEKPELRGLFWTLDYNGAAWNLGLWS